MSILHKEDWLKYPGATIDYDTKNKTFLHYAEVLYKMKVDNCAWPLALHRKELQGVDPFSPELSLAQKGMILLECKENIWYYLREVIRIPEPGSLNSVMFGCNRGNMAIFWLYLNHVTSISTILRQTGKTTTIASVASWLLTVGGVNTYMAMLTKDDNLRGDTLGKIKAILEELPEYVNLSDKKKDIFNSEEININFNSNKFKASLSSSSPKAAEKVGRGLVAPTIFIDEIAFVNNIEIAMGALLMAGNKARAVAQRLGKPYGTILTTTAGNINDRDANYVYGLVCGSAVWNEKLMDAGDKTELRNMVYKNCISKNNGLKTPMVNVTMSYRQLGYDEKWLTDRLEENVSSAENISRDIFNSWVAGTSESPIPVEYLSLMTDSKVEDPRVEIFAPYGFILNWYVSEEEMSYRENRGENFVAGVDTSDGVGRDDISLVLRSAYTGEVVCAAVFNEINLITLAGFFVDFLLRFSTTTMIIERRSSAVAILDYMILKLCQEGINPFTRLYNTIVQYADSKSKDIEIVMKARPTDHTLFTTYKKHLGFATSGTGLTSRNELYSSTLISSLKYTADTTRDSRLIEQISSLTLRNGRVDHAVNGNDDLVIGGLLSYFLLTKGENLHYYGIEHRGILKGNKTYLSEKFKVNETGYTEDELLVKEEEFTSLLDRLGEERNPIVSKQLEIKIRKIVGEMGDKSKVLSVEELLDNVKRERKLKRFY